MYYEVIPIRLFRAGAGILTYSSDLKLQPGHIVEIPLGRAKTYGIILKKVARVDFKTKPITKLLYDTPLPPHILKSILWLSQYYLTPLPTVAKLFLPNGIGKSRRLTTKVTSKSTAKNPTIDALNVAEIPLNSAQRRALKELKAIKTPTKLLHGITGSGKTNIYLKLAAETLVAEKSVILLVPEIALTSQLVSVFEATFGRSIVLIHSRQTEAERHKIWESILTAETPQIIIGPRSALLSPVKDLGLIIIDEAHESTYFQENAPKYSALRLASFMASSLKTTCLYGTATPLVADYYLAKNKGSLVTLSEKAKAAAKGPEVHIVSLRDQQNFMKNRYFSDQLLSAIKNNLEKHQQTLIFHNRRGSAPLTICENCGWQALCPNCFLPLTLHSDTYNLVCHTCGHHQKVPSSCPDCGHPSIIHKGFGTKLLESELNRLFKSARIIRFDADNAKAETLDAKFAEVKAGDYDIIIGTQTVAKGLDLPRLATVGVVQADAGLSLPDFSSEEKTFHLLTQVLGRVGRGHLDAAEAYVQTYQPDSPVIAAAINSDYDSFYRHTLTLRRSGHFPPFYYLARLSVSYKTEAAALKHIRLLAAALRHTEDILISPPTPAFHEHTAAGYNWQILLRARSRAALLSALKSLPETEKFHLTLDPPSLL